jgi:hypothetical protein
MDLLMEEVILDFGQGLKFGRSNQAWIGPKNHACAGLVCPTENDPGRSVVVVVLAVIGS